MFSCLVLSQAVWQTEKLIFLFTWNDRDCNFHLHKYSLQEHLWVGGNINCEFKNVMSSFLIYVKQRHTFVMNLTWNDNSHLNWRCEVCIARDWLEYVKKETIFVVGGLFSSCCLNTCLHEGAHTVSYMLRHISRHSSVDQYRHLKWEPHNTWTPDSKQPCGQNQFWHVWQR